MISISLCMIVKNEEDVIERVLDSVQDVVDEIIVADTGSVDRTKELAAKYTNHVYDFTWVDDFSAARNFSFSKATMDYAMWLDADDVLLEEDRKKILLLKETLSPDVDIVMMKYNMNFDENDVPAFSYYRERLVKCSRHYQWVEPIHEVIVPVGKVIYEDIAVSHKKTRPTDPLRNISIMEKCLAQGRDLSPRLQFYYARELSYQKRYQESADMFETFLACQGAWVENCINACYDLAGVYYMMEQPELALDALLSSFKYGAPRAEICCALGKHFLEKDDLPAAILWYKLASEQEPPLTSGGFYLIDCYGYVPYLQLCLCYDRLGDREKSVYYNEKAAEIKPNDRSVEYNRKYFSENPAASLAIPSESL